jgi:glutathione S-transferase
MALKLSAIAVSTICRAYMDAVMALPASGEWYAGALAETGVLAEDEVDWPIVLRA